MVSIADKTALLNDLKLLTIVRAGAEEELVYGVDEIKDENDVVKTAYKAGLIEIAIKGITKNPTSYVYGVEQKLDLYIVETVQTLLKNRKQALSGADQSISILSDADLDDILDDQESKQDKIQSNSKFRALDKYGGGYFN